MSAPPTRIDAFDLAPGRVLAGRYLVERKLGGGWEGEVYSVLERRTGIRRAAKLFFPHRNEHDRAVLLYAKKLERLRGCSLVTSYHNSETVRFRRVAVTCLLSEYVEGEILSEFVARRPGRRLPVFEALHLVRALARGLEDIHASGEYHGDLHADNVLVARRGVLFDVKVVDFFHHGRPSRARRDEDVADLIRLLYEAVGGRKRYAGQPREIKAICRGLRRDLIAARFPSARRLREHLEAFPWADDATSGKRRPGLRS